MELLSVLTEQTKAALASLYEINDAEISFEKTNANFAGDYTFVVFPYLRFSRKKPEDTAADVGEFLKNEVEQVSGYNVVKGFLNIELSNEYWLDVAKDRVANGVKIPAIGKGQKVVVEYSSPNTNKPLHLGHIRNMLLGFATANILSAAGDEVHKVNIYNDRGIAICKSMLAWQKFGEGKTPESEGVKSDHFVGQY